jgi:thiosulfate dehydrogenase (quinone) large subunit
MMQKNDSFILKNVPDYTSLQLTALVALRVLIGWHFLYEGIVKYMNPYWTSAGYLLESKWIFSGFFTSIASNPGVLGIVDFLNIWGLMAIGIGLMLGCFTRISTIAAVLLLILYYLANPPLIGLSYSMPTEGSYLVVNKNLVEMCALIVLWFFPTGSRIGFDRFIFVKKTA